jgi:SAM-dependent methyltransferase
MSEVALYEHAYGSFGSRVLAEVRQETYGEDVGQSSWTTADELRRLCAWAGLSPRTHGVDVCSGSGGPALFVARQSGCRLTGLDIHPGGLATARAQAAQSALQERVQFLTCDVTGPLPLEPDSVDAIWCIDSIIHLPDRLALLREWSRVLKPGGRFVYTDPTLVTGMVSKEEVVVRGAPGFFMYTPPGINERLIQQAGLLLLEQHDGTPNAVELSVRWREARAKRRDALVELEGREMFERMQHFLSVVHTLTRERRMCRVLFVGEKPAR